ncbi:MAG: CAAD domain-containing protein [Synechococcales cyanobacterium K44_A2020_017]|nr:CAAD domain-containing protein [Synechococcales cyanobacterium K32_A2020_035]MBF2094205.1 CAAD domain-containing protein [Synechococcales cyanobacterium K44_A2020_017]
MVEETEQTTVDVDINGEQSGDLAQVTASASNESQEQWQDIVDKVSAFLADLPAYLSEFFGEYKRPIITVGIITGSIVSVKLVLAVLGAINDIPLLSPLFELVGLGYSAWFVYRYLLQASSRKELAEDFTSLKEQVLGQTSMK